MFAPALPRLSVGPHSVGLRSSGLVTAHPRRCGLGSSPSARPPPTTTWPGLLLDGSSVRGRARISITGARFGGSVARRAPVGHDLFGVGPGYWQHRPAGCADPLGDAGVDLADHGSDRLLIRQVL